MRYFYRELKLVKNTYKCAGMVSEQNEAFYTDYWTNQQHKWKDQDKFYLPSIMIVEGYQGDKIVLNKGE